MIVCNIVSASVVDLSRNPPLWYALISGDGAVSDALVIRCAQIPVVILYPISNNVIGRTEFMFTD